MLTPAGPKLVEYNVRFGDPECEVILPGLQGDVAAMLSSAADGALDPFGVGRARDAAVIVMIASDAPAGGVITGVENADALDGVTVFHARTTTKGGALVTAGSGRILGVVGRGHTLRDARARAYEGVQQIDLPGGYYRTDIAAQAAESEQER
jgi:phosphoribosylamine--glycine ligase